MFYYEVAPTRIVRKSSDTLTYCSESELTIGNIVVVSVGKQHLVGVVMQTTAKPHYETKPISQILDLPPLPRPLLDTALWMSRYYATHLSTVLSTLLPAGITKKRRPSNKPSTPVARERTHFVLNSEQQHALATLTSCSPGTAILHGVTGSGKTAVYIEYAKTIIASGRSVILLVPEIALTSQLVAEFQHHFDDITLTHSHHTESERHNAWQQALVSQTPRVVIGPRSALFMPLASIGAIIIDEAHEPSYKQDKSPRYSGLRVASVLASHHAAVTVQGSATPLVSEYYLASQADRPIITMSSRATPDATEAAIEIVDMTKRGNFATHKFLSDKLLCALDASLAANQQVLLFHNRRGSATISLCTACGWSATCDRCFVPYTLHADTHTLQCHICGTSSRVPTHCPECASTDIVHKGIGTKLIESELAKRYPNKKIVRFDGDATSDDSVEQRYNELYDGSIDIIIGTQVVAKGLDLPHLRTVGIVQADAGLALPDYIASERTFQLLSQAIGRVGRNTHATTVIVQSYQPDAPAIRYGLAQDYDAFYHHTLAERQRAKFPPYRHLLKLTCIYKSEAAAARNATSVCRDLRARYPDVDFFGPTPAFYERQRDTYRWQIIAKASRRSLLTDIITHLPPTHWQYDLDPMTLL